MVWLLCLSSFAVWWGGGVGDDDVSSVSVTACSWKRIQIRRLRRRLDASCSDWVTPISSRPLLNLCKIRFPLVYECRRLTILFHATNVLWMLPRVSHSPQTDAICRHVRHARPHQLCTLQCMTVPVVRAFFSDRTQLAKRILVMAQFIFTIAWG